jgi:hypothetical protein
MEPGQRQQAIRCIAAATRELPDAVVEAFAMALEAQGLAVLSQGFSTIAVVASVDRVWPGALPTCLDRRLRGPGKDCPRAALFAQRRKRPARVTWSKQTGQVAAVAEIGLNGLAAATALESR